MWNIGLRLFPFPRSSALMLVGNLSERLSEEPEKLPSKHNQMGRHTRGNGWEMNLFSSLKNGTNEGYHFIPASHHPFCLVLASEKSQMNRKSKFSTTTTTPERKKRWSRAEWRKGKLKKLQFEIHMANKFYGKLYCGRSWIVRVERRKKNSFSRSTDFVSFRRAGGGEQRAEIYAVFKILFILKCASNVAHFFSFQLLSIRQMEAMLLPEVEGALWSSTKSLKPGIFEETRNLCSRRFKSTRDARGTGIGGKIKIENSRKQSERKVFMNFLSSKIEQMIFMCFGISLDVDGCRSRVAVKFYDISALLLE